MQEIGLFDVVIVGGGPAGMSAALWCRELGLNSLMVESGSKLGGQLNWTFNKISNYIGVNASNGTELRDRFLENLEAEQIRIRTHFEVRDIDLDEREIVSTEGETIAFRSLIVATGVRRRSLDVPGAKEFAGKGILTSGKKDRSFAQGKVIVIVGGGDAAFENVEILSSAAQKIYLVHRRSEFRARAEFLEFAQQLPKAEILTNTVVTAITGDRAVEAVGIRNLLTGARKELSADAVLVRIGVQPNTEFLNRRLGLDSEGYIEINAQCETSTPLVFAAGDVANPISPTISSAAGMGATAAKAIYSKLS